jgi:hypothetical protein
MLQCSAAPSGQIDDDVRSMALLIRDLLADSRHLLIAPDPTIGLTPEHLDRAQEFVTTLDQNP